MTYTTKIRNGHPVVDMTPMNDPVEFGLELLRFMTGYKAVEIFVDAIQDIDLSKVKIEEMDASKIGEENK